jgi:hypothetical protein
MSKVKTKNKAVIMTKDVVAEVRAYLAANPAASINEARKHFGVSKAIYNYVNTSNRPIILLFNYLPTF